jgi:CubicO group peptidase (beta-lactamase class C family)
MVFSELANWPVGTAAAAVADRHGLLVGHGPLDQPFALASVTKLLVAMAVLMATEEGVLDLDQPAGPPGSTIRHLLAHASGLAPDSNTVVAAPGTRRIYSNPGFEVLGAVLAEASQLPTATYVHEAVAEPLGLAHTVLEGSPAHGARSTVRDLAALAAELLHPTLLAPATLQEATTPVFPDLAGVLPGFGRQNPNPWGLGFEIRGTKSPHWTGLRNSARTFGHFGRAGTFCWIDPVAAIGCVVLTDTAFGPWAIEAWPAFSDTVVGWFGDGPAGSADGRGRSADGRSSGASSS